MYKICTVIISFTSGLQTFSQSTEDTTFVDPNVYRLGEIIVTAPVDKTTVNAAVMQKYNTKDVSNSLGTLPSIIVSGDRGRNESTVYLRGFDIRSVPVFIDGIPVYVPYDGYLDLARFITHDVSKIDVSKGFSSMTYGSNTIGGAINLVGIKPEERIEVNAKTGIMSGKGTEIRINLGSKLEKVYIQTNFSLLGSAYTLLPADFDTTQLETDHRRDNSDHRDIKGSLKVGYTPNPGDEYSLNYLYSHGSKGNPVYLGDDMNTRIRFWDWPYWDKQSLYYISETKFGTRSVLHARAYFDQFKNKLSSYDDNTYTSQDRPYAFNSYYDDYTLGGNLGYSIDWDPDNHLRLSLHIKNDNHSEHNDNEPVRHFADNTYSVGIENVYKPNSRLSFIPGLSYNIRQSLKAENYNPVDSSISDYPENNNDAINAQIATYYRISNTVSLSFNVALKSRFATMKDRYSYRLGTAIPNPDLKSETALNLELASSIQLPGKLTFKPELYYSRLDNTNQLVSNVQDDLSQIRNTGEAEFKGIDLSLIYQPLDQIQIYSAYSYIQRRNISNPEILFIDVPRHKFFGSVEYTFKQIFMIIMFGEYTSERLNASDGSRISPGYAVLNGQVSCHLRPWLRAEAGTNNIFDKNYTIQEGYPEAGRNYYIALYFSLSKQNK